MIRINLLPIRQLKKRARLKTELLGFSAALVLVLLVLVVGWFALAGKIANLQEELVALEQKKQSYQPILKQIDTLKKEKQMVEQKLDSIKKLQASARLQCASSMKWRHAPRQAACGSTPCNSPPDAYSYKALPWTTKPLPNTCSSWKPLNILKKRN